VTAVESLAGTVDLLDIHRRAPQFYPFLLQSVARHPQSGRYDLLLADPGARLQGPALLDALADDIVREAAPAHPQLPFVGGWFLYLAYEAARHFETALRDLPGPAVGPELLAVRCHGAIIVDHVESRTWLVSERSDVGLAKLRADVDLARNSSPAGPVSIAIDDLFEEPPERFVAAVERTIEYLRAGDIFQANLSRLWQARLATGSAADLYARLRLSNAAPFAVLADLGDFSLISSSPERLASISGRRIDTRPIAGTRPRSALPEQDEDLRKALANNIKERAEHVMLIDLERNDLGRVCVPGSIGVDELMVIESYAHVHHIVSNVSGQLREGVGPLDVLKAVFPGGTITGCPKVRSMEIIGELEGSSRGAYTGSAGYLSRCGRMDTNILIRTLVLHGDALSFRAGAGIVADSDPVAELAETRAKARGLLLALQGA